MEASHCFQFSSTEMELMACHVIHIEWLRNEGVCLSGTGGNESAVNAQLDLKPTSS